MSARPQLSKVALWERRVSLYREILCEALLLLRTKPLGRDEPTLNRALYQCILDVIRSRRIRGDRSLDIPPVFDGPNPPVDVDPTPQERKRPDLRWELIDHETADLGSAVVPFVIECKRLGGVVSGRVLTQLYVTTGVHRFVHEEWSYGRNAASGAMVGYVQSMTFSELLAEVNLEVVKLGLPALAAVDGSSEWLYEAGHSLVRTFAISPYALAHFWIDVRRKPSTAVPAGRRPAS